MAWNWAPKDRAVLQKMREAGLTVAGFVAPETLNACRAAGLKAIVSDPRTSGYDWNNVDEAKARKNVTSLVAKVGRHPAVYGYYLWAITRRVDPPIIRTFTARLGAAVTRHDSFGLLGL